MDNEDNSKAPIAPPSKKRSLFKKPTWADSDDSAQNSPEGIEFFSRAKELFPVRVVEQDRKRKDKLIKEECARSSASAEKEREDSSLRDLKRRRATPQGGEEKIYHSGSSRERSVPGRELSLPTPDSHKSQSSASQVNPPEPSTTLTQRFVQDISKPVPEQKVDKGYITLSDDSEDDGGDDILALDNNPLDWNSLGAVKPGGTTDHPVQLDDNDQLSDEEYPELVAKAREREKKQALERELSQKAFNNKNHASGSGQAYSLKDPDDDIFGSQVQPKDPIIHIFVTSRIIDTKPLLVKRKFTQKLKEVRLEWCRKQSYDGHPWTQEYIDSVFFTFKYKKYFDVSTCATMGLKLDHDGNPSGDGFDTQGTVHLEAWTEELYDAHKRRESGKGEDGAEIEVVQQPKEKRIKLILKSRDYEDYKVAVKKSTTFQKIIDVFRNTNGVPQNKSITLSLDGETLSPGSTVDDEDLEDMNIVEVFLK